MEAARVPCGPSLPARKRMVSGVSLTRNLLAGDGSHGQVLPQQMNDVRQDHAVTIWQHILNWLPNANLVPGVVAGRRAVQRPPPVRAVSQRTSKNAFCPFLLQQLPRLNPQFLGDAFQGSQGEVAFAALDTARVGVMDFEGIAETLGSGRAPGARRAGRRPLSVPVLPKLCI